jgi:hypothetical protein
MTQAKWLNEGQTILWVQEAEGRILIIEPGHPRWSELSSREGIEPYTPPPEPTPEEVLASERSRMVCTPAQMRLALMDAGVLDQVQAIADSDPKASIVWEYATRIVRNSPLIDALGAENGFTPEEVDDLFRQATKIKT